MLFLRHPDSMATDRQLPAVFRHAVGRQLRRTSAGSFAVLSAVAVFGYNGEVGFRDDDNLSHKPINTTTDTFNRLYHLSISAKDEAIGSFRLRHFRRL